MFENVSTTLRSDLMESIPKLRLANKSMYDILRIAYFRKMNGFTNKKIHLLNFK